MRSVPPRMKELLLGLVGIVLACTAAAPSASPQSIADCDRTPLICKSSCEAISLCAKTSAPCLEKIAAFASCLDSDVISFKGERSSNGLLLNIALGSEPAAIELAFPAPRKEDGIERKAANQEYEFRVGKCVRPDWPEENARDSTRWAVVILPKPKKPGLPVQRYRYFGFSNATCSGHKPVANAAHPRFMSVASYLDAGPLRSPRSSEKRKEPAVAN